MFLLLLLIGYYINFSKNLHQKLTYQKVYVYFMWLAVSFENMLVTAY